MRLNVIKTGRELDVVASGHILGCRLRAECKAEKDLTGSAAVNKFVGVLTRERSQAPDERIDGLFVSLSGFKDSTLTQEEETPSGIRLMDGDEVVGHLVAHRIVCAEEQVAYMVGGLLREVGLRHVKLTTRELWATRTGLIWVQFLGSGGTNTHAALVHGDGELVSPAVEQEIGVLDGATKNLLRDLKIVSQSTTESAAQSNALREYLAYLDRQSNEIEMTGLTADTELTARRYAMESLFVPRKLIMEMAAAQGDLPRGPAPIGKSSRRRTAPRPVKGTTVGDALVTSKHLVVLGDPGSGKSTLLRRLAGAYADPERRNKVDDDLPDRYWLPLLVRCRQLPAGPVNSISDLLEVVVSAAELQDHAKHLIAAFRARLRDGTALILIDGLDEIPDAGRRLELCRQIETFSGQYAACHVVVTSRIVGYRELGFRLGHEFNHATVADFEAADINRYLHSWFGQIEPSAETGNRKAAQLYAEIMSNPRVLRLAQNPLMLATLTLIRRWVGELPKKRSTLYQEAVQVLLVNWNREAHDPLDPDEALPQLEFLAFWMMRNGKQQVTRKELLSVLRSAREHMPDVLGNAKTSPGEFLATVEYRSSLLSEVGRRVVDGELTPVYEFRHLTFGEYLAARAAVLGHYEDYSPESSSLVDTLLPHLTTPAWREVFPLACVLAGRHATVLIERALDKALALLDAPAPATPGGYARHDAYDPTVALQVVMLSLADEPSVNPATADRLFPIIPHAVEVGKRAWLNSEAMLRLGESVYRERLVDTLLQTVLPLREFSMYAASLLAQILARDIELFGPTELGAWVASVEPTLTSQDDRQSVLVCLAAMELGFSALGLNANRPTRVSLGVDQWLTLGEALSRGLWHRRHAVRVFSAWAIAWVAMHGGDYDSKVAARLATLCVSERAWHARRMFGWALSKLVASETIAGQRGWQPAFSNAVPEIICGFIRHATLRQDAGTEDTVFLDGGRALSITWGKRAQTAAVDAAFKRHMRGCKADHSSYKAVMCLSENAE